MKNVLIVGAGRLGLYTAKKLHQLGHHVMAVDKKEERVNRILPYVVKAEIGDSTDESFLSSIGVDDYDLCVVAIGNDFLACLETTFMLKELGAKVIVSRATSFSQEKFLLRNGASSVVFPERELGDWVAIRFGNDNISNYIELSDGYSLVEAKVPSHWHGKRVGELDVRKKHGLNILGVKNDRMDMNVNSETLLEEGANLLVLGKYTDIAKAFKL